MAANISALGNLQSAEPLDLDMYEDAQESSGFKLAPSGRYTLRAPDSFQESDFTPTKSGSWQARIDPTIVGPTNDGFTLRYTRISGKTFQRGNKTVSFVGDYLRACGVRGTIPGDAQAQAELIMGTASTIYEGDLDWEASFGRKGEPDYFQVKGMNNFPSDGKGGHQSWVEHPTVKGEDGKPLRLLARLVIRRFIPRT